MLELYCVPIVQLDRTPASDARNHRFESCLGHHNIDFSSVSFFNTFIIEKVYTFKQLYAIIMNRVIICIIIYMEK